MTHGRSFFHSEYQSPPSHPRPSSAAAHGLLPSAASTPGRLTGRPGSLGQGANSPHAHTASSPLPRCGAPEGSRCLPAPWGGRRGTLPGLEAFTWARQVWWLLPRRERTEGGSCPRRGPRPWLEAAAEGEGARGSAGSRGGGGGGRTGHGSRRASGRGRRFRLKSTRISKEAPKYITYSSKSLGASRREVGLPLPPPFCAGSAVLKGFDWPQFLPALLCAPTPVQ